MNNKQRKIDEYKAREGTASKVANYVPEPVDNRSIMEILAELSQTNPTAYEEAINKLVEEKGEEWFKNLRYDWSINGRPKQFPPMPLDSWRAWCILAGRGFGKSRTGAETVRLWVDNHTARMKPLRIALVGPTAGDVNGVMVGGEALDITTPIITPNGWSTMEHIKVGDYVISENGSPALVIWESGLQYNRVCYEVVFNDGSKIVADANHKWYTNTRRARRVGSNYRFKVKDSIPTIFTTEEIKNSLTAGKNRTSFLFNHSIPLAKPLEFSSSADLPIHPYVLGYWLGDGSSKSQEITTMDTDVVDYISSLGYEIRVQPHSETTKSLANCYGILKLKGKLKTLNVLSNKHIPDIYLRAPIEDRKELLRGLLDSDGTCGSQGRISFYNTNSDLIVGVYELLLGLGVKVRKASSRLCDLSTVPLHTLNFSCNFRAFNIERKAKRQRLNQAAKATYRTIIEVTPVTTRPVKCIAVDTPTQLYLAGKECIPTHNSGILSIYPDEEKPEWTTTSRKLTWRWPDGSVKAIAETFSAEEPQRLRGPQFHLAWVDELAAFRYQEAWDMLMFGLRLGDNPQVVVTTTPRPYPILMELLKLPTTYTTIGSTYENRSNLAPAFFTEIITKYEGSTLGRQELMAEIIEEVPNAMWNIKNIDENRIAYDDMDKLPEFLQIVLAIDPATTTRTSSAETGMCVAAYGEDDHFYILHLDAVKMSPEQWARRSIKLFNQYGCDKMIAEVNNGGDLVEAVIKAANPMQKVYAVHASRGKTVRAEPVAALYEQNRVHHIGRFHDGESQMSSFNPIENPYGLKDQVDALVWAMVWLIEATQGRNTYKPIVGGSRDKLSAYKDIFRI